MNNRKSEVYDLETLASLFTYTGLNIDTEGVSQFILHKNKFQLQELIDHLLKLKGQIGFNNLRFDYPIIHYILLNYKKWYDLVWKTDWEEEIISLIYQESQRIINNQNEKDFYPEIKDREVKIKQLDLFRVWHYDNRARMTGLKSLEISMNYPNVMDMPIHHSTLNISLEDAKLVLDYNLNDVLATYEFYKRSEEKLNLRKQIFSKYKIDCINYPDTKIGEELVLKLYCEATDKNPNEIRKLRTYRSKLDFKDCIPSYIKYNSTQFNDLIKYLEKISVSNLKNSFAYSVIYKGFKYDLGTGGIHGANEAGVYIPKDNEIIKDSDVASLYPNLAITNNLYPEHLGEEFCIVYKEGIVDERIRAKNAKEMSISDALKLSANGIYGKSNSEYSFVYDPLYTIKTTLAGQLSLCMLGERLQDQIPNIKVIQVNTDGITTLFDKKYNELYDSICKIWEQETSLTLEHCYYSKFIMKDVNNYSAISEDGSKIKNKGVFEVDKMVGNERAYHKDNSFRVVPLAIQEYFLNNISIKDTIINHNNIYDFCGRQKFGRDSSDGEIHYLNNEGKYIKELQQKTVRYYISKSNKKFIKVYSKGTTEEINKGYEVEVFNKYIKKEFKDYKINYNFYIKEANKIIDILEPKQLKMF